MISGTERLLRARYCPETLLVETPVEKSSATWTLVMKAAGHGEDYVFEACNQHNMAHGRLSFQSFILPADVPGVGSKGDWVLKHSQIT
jgi:hypothetical protein